MEFLSSILSLVLFTLLLMGIGAIWYLNQIRKQQFPSKQELALVQATVSNLPRQWKPMQPIKLSVVKADRLIGWLQQESAKSSEMGHGHLYHIPPNVASSAEHLIVAVRLGYILQKCLTGQNPDSELYGQLIRTACWYTGTPLSQLQGRNRDLAHDEAVRLQQEHYVRFRQYQEDVNQLRLDNLQPETGIRVCYELSGATFVPVVPSFFESVVKPWL